MDFYAKIKILISNTLVYIIYNEKKQNKFLLLFFLFCISKKFSTSQFFSYRKKKLTLV